MALNLGTFNTDLKAALLRVPVKNQKDNVDVDMAMENLAHEIATGVDKYIKTAPVSTPVSATVAGTCPAQSGAGTIAGTGSLS